MLDGKERAALQLAQDRRAYVHVSRGSITASGTLLGTGNGLKMTDTPALTLSDPQEAEVLVFDSPDERH